MNAPESLSPDALFDQTALVLQGGGALGAYQAGVYEALHEAGVEPGWIAGISIGAINAAILAGNPPAGRLERLRSFWQRITRDDGLGTLAVDDTASRRALGLMSSAWAVAGGIAGFFRPRLPSAWFALPGSAQALSHYDTAPLRRTLLEHVDFARINDGPVRLSLGAVNVRTGNFSFFDSRRMQIGPEHVMASGALPPGFPPIEIDGEYFWDGGLVSNTPLAHVLDQAEADRTLVFQVDLFSALGPFPQTLIEVEERRKDIVFSSRTRLNTDHYRAMHALRLAIGRLADRLPAEALREAGIAELSALRPRNAFSVVHLIYRRAAYDGPNKDYEFSRRAMRDHWRAGLGDAHRTLRSQVWRQPPRADQGIAVFDTNRAGVL